MSSKRKQMKEEEEEEEEEEEGGEAESTPSSELTGGGGSKAAGKRSRSPDQPDSETPTTGAQHLGVIAEQVRARLRRRLASWAALTPPSPSLSRRAPAAPCAAPAGG